MPEPGRVALISQSGALCTSILEWAKTEKIGFSHFVSVGNMLDVGVADLIDYFANDPETKSIILYVESITGARSFLSAARDFTRTKPIVAYKSGRFAQSAKAAASHTGAMAVADDVYDAAFRRAGIERTFEIDELFDTAELLARHAPPRGPRLAIVTNAGGPGVIATDALIARHGVLAELSDHVISQLDACLPSCWSGGNPVDILGDATAGRFTDALRPVLADDQIEAVLVILTPQAMTVRASFERSIVDNGLLMSDAWFQVTLFDAYLGFFLFCLRVAYKESSVSGRIVWFLLIICFGNMATTIYILLQLRWISSDEPVSAILLPAGNKTAAAHRVDADSLMQ